MRWELLVLEKFPISKARFPKLFQAATPLVLWETPSARQPRKNIPAFQTENNNIMPALLTAEPDWEIEVLI